MSDTIITFSIVEFAEIQKNLQPFVGRNVNIISDLFVQPIEAKLIGFDEKCINVTLIREGVWSPYSWAAIRHIFSQGFDEHPYAASPRVREVAEMVQYS